MCTEKYLASVGQQSLSAASQTSTTVDASTRLEEPRLTLECLLNVLQGTLTQSGTVFCATTNHIERLQPALFRSGRFDLNIDMKLCDRDMIAQIYRSFMSRTLPEHLMAKIPENVYTCSDVMFALSPLIFSNLTDTKIVDQILAIKPGGQTATTG